MQCDDEPQAAAPQRGRPAANRMFFYPRGGPLLASLVPTLAVTAIVAIVLIGHGRFARRHPNPAALRSPDEPTQGISVLGLLCVMLSAAIPILCFVSVGAQYPALEFADPAAMSDAPLAATVAGYLVICACVGFYEEGAFRVVLQDLFARGFLGNGMRRGRCALYAAIASSALFAVLHAASPIPAGADSVQVAMQAALKCLQGMLFGLAMTGLLARTGSFALVVAVHACYDLLFFLPWVLDIGGFPSTYLTGLAIDTFALAANCVCLAPAAVLSLRLLAYGGAVQPRMR